MKLYLSTLKQKFLSVAKKVWRLTPVKLRERLSRIRFALQDNSYILQSPAYADDGLISQHVTGFLKNSKFMDAYALGRETGALVNHPGDIHFRAYIACWAAKYASELEGDFVECGVGKGLLSKTIVNYLDFQKIPKNFYLFDTFEGIPVGEEMLLMKKNVKI